ncbi:fimbrial protein [Morganella morganii]|uniref:fimbrial protein n=1 Tax=Morganella morganii TaxID=582 RepID=UPI0032DAF6CB
MSIGLKILIFSIHFVLAFIFPLNAYSETVNFDGVLVADPCEVYPGDENIELNFGTVIDKYLYINTRTHSQLFSIRLINCDLMLGKEVNVTFTGTESDELKGMLALNTISQSSGIVIGLETETGEPVALNKKKSYVQLLHSGHENIINLKAYVQGEPNALINKSIRHGWFLATMNFILEYE